MPITLIESDVPYDSSIYLVTGDRNILVDAGSGADHPAVERRIRGLVRELDMIVATHCHYDHVGGMARLAHSFSCPVYAFGADAQAMRDADDSRILASAFGGSVDPMEVSDLREGEVIDNGAHRLQVIHTPGHTAGSICLHDAENGLLISGDTLFLEGVGRTDFPGGSMSQLRDSLRRLSNIEIRELYPGHGSVCYSYGPQIMRRALTLVGV